MMLQSVTVPLLTITLTHILGSSLAAPGPPIKSTEFPPGSNVQLNGVPGPYYDGAKGADSAEVAGILATLILHEGNGDTGNKSESDDKNANSDLSLFVVMNEYKLNQLIRQSNCFQEIENGMRVLNVSQRTRKMGNLNKFTVQFLMKGMSRLFVQRSLAIRWSRVPWT